MQSRRLPHVLARHARLLRRFASHPKECLSRTPVFTHPAFDMESRIVQAEFGKLVLASVYVPNGNKDYPAKLDFFRRLIAWAKELREAGRELILCGDMNITRTEMDVHPKERKPGSSVSGRRSASSSASC